MSKELEQDLKWLDYEIEKTTDPKRVKHLKELKQLATDAIKERNE